jgi:RNA recognition motif-containing protein
MWILELELMKVLLSCRNMQSDSGKLFIGGISWDTNEERLKEYFSSYGEVVEAVIMKDRTTGRARGFGFVVFADPAVADRVVKEKHNIDGRMVSFNHQLHPEIYTMQYELSI